MEPPKTAFFGEFHYFLRKAPYFGFRRKPLKRHPWMSNYDPPYPSCLTLPPGIQKDPWTTMSSRDPQGTPIDPRDPKRTPLSQKGPPPGTPPGTPHPQKGPPQGGSLGDPQNTPLLTKGRLTSGDPQRCLTDAGHVIGKTPKKGQNHVFRVFWGGPKRGPF